MRLEAAMSLSSRHAGVAAILLSEAVGSLHKYSTGVIHKGLAAALIHHRYCSSAPTERGDRAEGGGGGGGVWTEGEKRAQ